MEVPIQSNSRPGLTTFCYKLPDGRQVKAEELDEGTMVEHCDWNWALGSIVDFIANKKWPVRWRAKKLGNAVKAQREMRKNTLAYMRLGEWPRQKLACLTRRT
jgi:hypothetical protein